MSKLSGGQQIRATQSEATIDARATFNCTGSTVCKPGYRSGIRIQRHLIGQLAAISLSPFPKLHYLAATRRPSSLIALPLVRPTFCQCTCTSSPTAYLNPTHPRPVSLLQTSPTIIWTPAGKQLDRHLCIQSQCARRYQIIKSQAPSNIASELITFVWLSLPLGALSSAEYCFPGANLRWAVESVPG